MQQQEPTAPYPIIDAPAPSVMSPRVAYSATPAAATRSLAADGEATAPPPFNYGKSKSAGRHLFGDSFADPNLSDKGGSEVNWTSYTQSRIMVRLFTRGLMGATLYTLANRWIPGQLKGYTEHGAIDASKPLQYLARGFDIAYGKPIQWYVRNYHQLAGKSAEEAAKLAKDAITFRETRNFGSAQNPIWGRSVGNEVVAMSTDFAAGSIGDSWGREIAGMLDPSITNSWTDKDDGHVHWDIFAKSVGQSAWRIFSKNQGEDWAVALPYVYQMKFQRNAINRLYKGFRITSDHGHNGGSWRINEQGHILDSFSKAGALDLQLRFTGYNWYTLMFRDLYDNIGERIEHYRETGKLSSPETSTGQEGLLNNTAHLFRYIAKSGIKAFIYMTPAVPFFWITRTPQTKSHGMGIFVDPISGEAQAQKMNHAFNPYLAENTRGVFDRLTTPFGKACFEASEAVNAGIRTLKLLPEEQTRYRYTNPTFGETLVNSSLSYTPYMIAKAETALRWDRPKGRDGMNGMDRGIYRFLDGAVRLNLGEVKAGLSDMRHEITNPPSNREIHEQRTKQQAPQTLVTDITEEDKKKAQDAAPPQPQASARWREQLHTDFGKTPFPSEGATIH